jgi:Ca2+-transporting ATPase
MQIEFDGLTTPEAEERLARHGPNALPRSERTPLWRRFVDQFRSPLIYILLFALVFDVGTWVWDGGHGPPVEALAIGVILLLNAVLGTLQEYRSEQALAQLESMAAPQAWAFRDGNWARVPSPQLVPDDVVRIEAGERVPADGRLLQAEGLLVDEAILTGESVPVDKRRADEAMSGTLVVRGKAVLQILRTGADSSMGKLASMIGEIEAEATPLEVRLDAFGRQIARWVGALALTLAAVGLAVEGLSRFEEMILFAVALAVAAVPEGMPAVVTLTLALGVQRMAGRKAVVRRLAAVEALGSVTVIATDKTGTITENSMRVAGLESDAPDEALLAMVLANDAEEVGEVGDPLELGLLAHARAEGLDIVATREAHPRSSSRPFDSEWKYMRVTVDDGTVSYLKGAPEVLLARCAMPDAERAAWASRAEAAAREGHRVLALAAAEGASESDLRLLGLVKLWDPPRAEVPDAIRTAQQAGVRVVMITGDHPGTAAAVAKAVGMESAEVLTGADLDRLEDETAFADAACRASVFARVTPEHKLRLVEALKGRGAIVAMTGDGVNDAPALKRADVGVAMGQRGSDVTREVADLVLLDDNFATIVDAIEEGRSIYENIQKFIRFLFSTNLALVVLVLLGAVGAFVLDLREETGLLLLPLTAIQLLWINFVGDGPPALALALDRNRTVMNSPPRPPETPLLDRPSRNFVVWSGLVKAFAGAGLLAVLPLLGYGLAAVRTAVFLFEALAQLAFVYPSRSLRETPDTNTVLHGIVVLGILLQVGAVLFVPLQAFLGLEPLDVRAFVIVFGCTAVTWAVAVLVGWINGRTVRSNADG